METASLSAAINLVNEVSKRFRPEEGVCKRFLDLVIAYGGGLMDMEDVRVQVASIFENHPDLLGGFLGFASDLKGKRRSIVSIIEKFERVGLKGVYDRGQPLFNKIARGLSQSAFMEFLRHCRSYGSQEIERNDLIRLVAGVLGDRRRLLDEFDEFLDCCGNGTRFLGGVLGEKSPNPNKRNGSPIGEDEFPDQPDRSKRQRVTPSYYLLPSAGQRPTLEDDHLLSQCVVCMKEGENYSRRERIKSKEERLRDDYEDKRYEVDMLLASITSATKAAEKLNKIGASSKNPIRVGEYLQAKDLRCIERLYGDHGIELLRVLHDNPRDVLPVILPRLQQKLEEVKEWARAFSFEKYSQQFIKA